MTPLLFLVSVNIKSHIKLHIHKCMKFEQIFIHLFIFRVAKIGILIKRLTVYVSKRCYNYFKLIKYLILKHIFNI